MVYATHVSVGVVADCAHFAVDALPAPEMRQLLSDWLAPDADHQGKAVAETDKQIDREIADVLRSLPKDKDGKVKSSDVANADWDNKAHPFGPGTSDAVKKALQDKGGKS